jgi:hypothetical protein
MNFWLQYLILKTFLQIHNKLTITNIFNKILDILKVESGSVNPFALINDTEHKITHVILDQNLKSYEYLAFHPVYFYKLFL